MAPYFRNQVFDRARSRFEHVRLFVVDRPIDRGPVDRIADLEQRVRSPVRKDDSKCFHLHEDWIVNRRDLPGALLALERRGSKGELRAHVVATGLRAGGAGSYTRDRLWFVRCHLSRAGRLPVRGGRMEQYHVHPPGR
jgi:hypothetical protein